MALTRPKYSNIVDTDYKASCRVVTTTNITLSGGAPSTYDSVTLAVGDRILVTGQDTGSQNGIYTVATLGTGSNGTWSRAFDANDGTRLSAGMQTTIGAGTYGGKRWQLTTPDPIVIGSTSLTFVEGSGTPGGFTKQVQFNNSGTLGGATNLEYIIGNGAVIATGNIEAKSNMLVSAGSNRQMFYNNNGTLAGAASFEYILGNGAIVASANVESKTNINTTALYTNQLIWAANGSGIISDVPDPSVYLGIKTITTATTLIDTVPIAGNVGFRWTVTAKDTINSRFRYGILDSVNDGTTVYYNEYSKIFSNPAYPVGTFTSNITSGNINLWGVGDSASVQVTFQRLSLGSLTVEGYSKQKMAIGPRGDITGTTGVIQTSNTTPATSTTTGALLVPGGAGIQGNLYIGGNTVVSSNLTVLGNLIVQGDTTTLNTATLDVEDLNITVAKGAASAAAANGAGLTVDGAGATILYTSASDTWNFNKGIIVTSGSLTNITGAASTLVATNFSSGNAQVTGGSITGITGAASTFVVTNFSTGNLQATGGSATGITGAASTFVATNFSTGNIWATGGYIDNTSIGANTAAQNVNTVNFKAANLLLSGNTVTSGNITFSSIGTLSYAAESVAPKQYHDAFAVVFGY
jgi:hypothetical protein